MVRSSTYKDEQYNIYELHAELGHTVTSGEAGTPGEIVLGTAPIPVQAHAIVEVTGGDLEYARAYIDGTLTTITSITNTTADTVTIVFPALVEGEVVDIYFPSTTGSLSSNTLTGKLTLPRMQSIQNWSVASNLAKVPECGTERKEPIEFAAKGMITLGLNRHGNVAMADFVAAREGKSDGTEIFLLIDVSDSTVSPTTHDILLEARVESYGRMSKADDSIGGIVTDIVTFSFQPDVVTL